MKKTVMILVTVLFALMHSSAFSQGPADKFKVNIFETFFSHTALNLSIDYNF